MDSPERHRISRAPTSSSPTTVQESPLTNFLENLSPIKSTKGTSHVQRINFSIPPPVFTSPRLDLQRDTTFIKREETDAAGSGVYAQDGTHLKAEFFQNEDKSCSPSGCIDQYLVADPAEIEDTTKSSHPLTTHKDTISKTDDDHVESNMFTGPYPGSQHEQFVPQAAEDQDDKVGGSYQSFHQSLQSAGAYKDSAESSRPVSRGSVKEADQHQRGIRRHLQFGVTMASKRTGNETHDNTNLSLPESLIKFKNMVPYNVEPIRISSSWQAGSHSQAVTFLSSFCQSQSFRSAQNCGNHDMSACTPSVLGLPSSSITRSESMGSDSTASKMLAGNMHAQEEKQMPNMNCCSAKDLDSISISSVAREIYARVEDDQQENQAAATIVPYEGRMLTSHNTDIVEELYQVSPKQNRKRAKPINESESCKRCNCKRSKCLKLYCECFAAGVYCLDSCACENCFNRPEYEDTVLDTRQQIEARNPLAFAPKVVKHAMNSPANMLEEGNWNTPSSARHKRGCNCKKSKCLKKYCECYQARVGCSNGCRCEGCNNSFGKKAESIYRRAEKWENTSHEQLDPLETRDDFIKAGRAHQFSSTWEALADISNLSPLPHCRSGAVAASASLNIRDSSKVSHAQVYQGSNLQSSSGYLHFHHSPSSLTPKSYRSEALPELRSDSLLYNILKKDDTPEKLESTFTPTKAVKASSPNKKRVSPLQSRSEELRSSSSQELRSGRKFILPAVSSFPSLTPYSKMKDGVQHTDDDNQDSNSCQ